MNRLVFVSFVFSFLRCNEDMCCACELVCLRWILSCNENPNPPTFDPPLTDCEDVFVDNGWTADVFDECEVEKMRGLTR